MEALPGKNAYSLVAAPKFGLLRPACTIPKPLTSPIATFDSKRHFITYTDIGLFRSEDGGTSWTASTDGVPDEWRNTTYWVVFDPKVKGRMWSVNSGTHDLPRPKMWRHTSVTTYKGGVCRSDDGGA